MSEKMVQLVGGNMDKFGDKAKLAADLAALLDNGLLDLSQGQERQATVAGERLKLLERFRALCLAAGVTPPAFEAETLRALIPAPGEDLQKKAGDLSARIRLEVDGLPGSEVVGDLLALGRATELLPSLVADFSESRRPLLARVDLLLLALGKEPLGLLNAGDPGDGPGGRLPEPSRTLRVLIVDDCVDEIVKTFSALAGSPGLEIGCFRVQIDWGADRQAALQQTAAAVLAAKPDIVLMDQGMPCISGSQLVGAIGGMLTEHDHIVFVGNTGGSPEELNEAGAIGNCGKGRDLSPVRQAIRMLAAK